MKKALFIMLAMIMLNSCEKGKIVKGEFIYYEGAAVLQTDTTVFGVVINDKANELAELSKEYKIEVTDMIPVELEAKIIPKKEGEEGWDYMIDIQKILKVSKSNSKTQDVITLGNK